jgi:uncharacterized membrane protein
MTKNRLEAFSDGVLAIIITIMVLEMHAPHTADLASLRPLVPVFISYALSFTFVGIYWNNHHHMIQAAERVNGSILWANLHLLFWLSLIPFTTAWMGLNEFASAPVALYGVVLLLSGSAYFILARLLAAHHGKDSTLAKALGSDRKGKVSIALYAVAIPLAFFSPKLAYSLYALVAVIWLYPDSRFENALSHA